MLERVKYLRTEGDIGSSGFSGIEQRRRRRRVIRFFNFLKPRLINLGVIPSKTEGSSISGCENSAFPFMK